MGDKFDNVIIYPGAVIESGVEIGPFTVIYPDVTIKKNVKIGSGCIIGKLPSVGKNQLSVVNGDNLTQINEDVIINDHVIVYSGSKIGTGTYIADKALVRENVVIENDVVIGTETIISYNANIQEKTKIMSGCNIAGNTVIGKGSFIGVHVCSVTDNNPFAMEPRHAQKGPQIGGGVFIGSNATLLPGVKIEDGIIVGAGSVVTKHLLEKGSIYFGNPCHHVKTKKRR